MSKLNQMKDVEDFVLHTQEFGKCGVIPVNTSNDQMFMRTCGMRDCETCLSFKVEQGEYAAEQITKLISLKVE